MPPETSTYRIQCESLFLEDFLKYEVILLFKHCPGKIYGEWEKISSYFLISVQDETEFYITAGLPFQKNIKSSLDSRWFNLKTGIFP